jgi:hypothetical protein
LHSRALVRKHEYQYIPRGCVVFAHSRRRIPSAQEIASGSC